MDDAKYVFIEDSKSKKQISHSAAKRVGKTKKCTLPYELLTGKEKKKYMAEGEVITYKFAPMTLKEFDKVPADRQMDLLKWYGEKFGWNAAGVAFALGCSFNHGKTLLERYMLVDMFKARMKNCTKEQKAKFMENRKAHANASETLSENARQVIAPERKNATEGNSDPCGNAFTIRMSCSRDGATLQNQLIGIARSLDRSREYRINLSISEVFPNAEDGEGDVSDA